MIIKNLGMLLKPSARSKAYLQKLMNADLKPAYALVMQNLNEANEQINNYRETFNNEYPFNPNQPETYTLKKNQIEHVIIPASSFNDEAIINALKIRNEKYFIFSGLDILKGEILNLGKKFIHIHPGKLPDYKGSTCIHYSILNEDKCYASAFFMEDKLDSGEVIAIKEFKKPGKEDITKIYDPNIRAELLVEVVKKLARDGRLEGNKQEEMGGVYFIIHPVLEHLVNLYCRGE